MAEGAAHACRSARVGSTVAARYAGRPAAARPVRKKAATAVPVEERAHCAESEQQRSEDRQNCKPVHELLSFLSLPIPPGNRCSKIHRTDVRATPAR